MPCYKPLTGWREDRPNLNNRYEVLFSKPKGRDLQEIKVPCGRCIGCRLDRSRTWAIRIAHESALHDENSFITLTYDPEHVPPTGSLLPRDWDLFLKLLRQKLAREKPSKKISFYMAGEYGEKPEQGKKFGRPHFHAIIFGWKPKDLEPIGRTPSGNLLYKSQYLLDVWKKGHVSVGEVTMESGGYVARYVTKKITGDLAEEHYKDIDLNTGELIDMEPEFTRSSRRPAIGKEWYKKYKTDLKKGYLVVKGVKMTIPKYYEKLMEKDSDIHYGMNLDYIKYKRQLLGEKNSEDNTEERLAVKEEVKLKKIQILRRGNKF